MTDAEKREKVIRGLEAHANPKLCETCAGEECPYYNSGGSYTEVTCSCFLAADALALLKEQKPITGDTSDGYHTFNELYHHRAVLFSVIVRDHKDLAWKSTKHSDGTMYDGMFIVGIETPSGQATYHYDMAYWYMFDCKELETAPEWDGHTPAQAIARIGKLKEQEARVFNVGDFYGEEFGYLEYRSDIPGFSNFEPSPVLIGDIDEENVTVIFRSASVQKLPLDRMNKNWRIWSEYPTHELLRAVKWEGDSDGE